ncbi:TPA: hypothetical protein ACT5B2_007124 [Burkholderia cenocepacia]|uniref:hypothetical protein n=1 Tax=Burkholderia cenocepacia TaxID=95486 RepID=UPI001902F077|nr:hypothetical protein [Burkholderia cenocepacia]MBJ9900617.1 hypothetical protein [Burkholderia cenocepacia]MBJ9918683.1 hypothetical protein [Burkholderia cenocepacia]MBR8102224.1 hypothetical protein [Burkholderia cenocepacia]MBR8118501.1 hypothetical protein [Burkholderia cenocepacia]MBR8139852.1 hypothetical protein [Burkholderia cenocepacia]
MEASLVEATRPEHTIDGWFDTKRVARLAAACIATFEDMQPVIAMLVATDVAERRVQSNRMLPQQMLVKAA